MKWKLNVEFRPLHSIRCMCSLTVLQMTLRRRFTIKPPILWYHKFIFWYHRFDFVMSKNNMWCYKIFCDISKMDFLISKKRFSDITKSNLWYQKIIASFFYHEFCDITNSILWYHKIEFLISQYHIFISILLYQKIDFVISKKWNFWYKKNW